MKSYHFILKHKITPYLKCKVSESLFDAFNSYGSCIIRTFTNKLTISSEYFYDKKFFFINHGVRESTLYNK